MTTSCSPAAGDSRRHPARRSGASQDQDPA